MPYSNPKQATAIFLDIQRKRGQAAAKAFADRHRGDMKRAAQDRSSRTYNARKRRSK